jgi:two-component system NtrC family sensor kinase
MKFTLLLILVLLLAGFGLYYYKIELTGNEAIRHDITERLLIIDGLDSKVNDFALRNRYSLDNNYDKLAQSSSLLNKSIEDLENTYFKETDESVNPLHRKFKELRSEIEIKKNLIENFKSHNSILKNSQKYAPVAGKKLMLIAEEENLPDAAKLYSEVIMELLEFSLLGTVSSNEKLDSTLPKLLEVEKQMPEYALSTSIEFINHLNTVIREKKLTDNYLSKALASSTKSHLSDLSKVWTDRVLKNVEIYEN